MRESKLPAPLLVRLALPCVALLLAVARPAAAGTVTLYWHSLDATTSGTLVLATTGTIADPNNFSLTGNVAALKADIQSFSYTNASGTFSSAQSWVLGGAGNTAANFASQLLLPSTAGAWTVANGVLTSIFAIESGTAMQLSGSGSALFGGISGLPNAGANALSGNGSFTISNTGTLSLTGAAAQGYWSTTAVPLPAAGWLLGSGLAALAAARRRRAVPAA